MQIPVEDGVGKGRLTQIVCQRSMGTWLVITAERAATRSSRTSRRSDRSFAEGGASPCSGGEIRVAAGAIHRDRGASSNNELSDRQDVREPGEGDSPKMNSAILCVSAAVGFAALS